MAIAERSDLFLRLTPDRVLASVESAGLEITGVCYPLNSFENRVYEVEREGGERVIAKFYRPERWREAQILEEHRFLAELAAAELPVCTVRPFPSGETLARIDGIFYCLSDRRGGRAPDELSAQLAERLGMFIGRMHAVAVVAGRVDRPLLDADRYVRRALGFLDPFLPSAYRPRYVRASEAIAAIADERLAGTVTHRIHGDLHLGNVLQREGAIHVLDFDDMAIGPPVQDLWLALPGRDAESLALREYLIDGYERFRLFDRRTLALIEPLRGLRMVRYAGWLARRWHDPAFKRAWPHFGSEDYWRAETADVEDQLAVIESERRHTVPGETERVGRAAGDAVDASELTNKDYFWDWEGE